MFRYERSRDNCLAHLLPHHPPPHRPAAWSCWMGCVFFQWAFSFSSVVAMMMSFVRFNARFRECMVEFDGGLAVLNVALPVMLLHPVILTQLFLMWGQFHAFLTGCVREWWGW